MVSKVKMMNIPNPGSDAAIKLGCICPVMDNAHGRGYLGGAKDEHGNLLFLVTQGCPVHDKEYKE